MEGVKTVLGSVLTEEQKALFTADTMTHLVSIGLVENFLNVTLGLRDGIKEDTWSICFSEDGFNEVLWLKYADKYKGFVQFYDLENDDNYLCGKQEKCQNCGIKNFGTPLYPIYYSDKPYNANNLAKIVMLKKLEEVYGTQIPQYLYDGVGNGMWERERATLIKKKCHEYDKEWRMITYCPMKPPIMMEWIPSGIILGLRMSADEERLVINNAKEAGIKNIYKSVIDSKNRLNVIRIMLE